MSARLEVLITFLLYLCFFAWIGWRRGAKSELIVFATAWLAWLALQEQGDLFVRLANLGGKFVTFVQAGGLSANPDPAFEALRTAPQVVTDDSRQGYLFILWALILLLAYLISSQRAVAKGSKSDGWSILLGLANGLLFASVFLPRLIALVAPEGAIDLTMLIARTDLLGILGPGFGLLLDALAEIWAILEPQSSLVLVLLLTLFLGLAASTLRGKPRSKERT
jgi:hypothetical protein